MEIIRYINNEPVIGNKMPPMSIENPGVLETIKDVQYRVFEESEKTSENKILS